MFSYAESPPLKHSNYEDYETESCFSSVENDPYHCDNTYSHSMTESSHSTTEGSHNTEGSHSAEGSSHDTEGSHNTEGVPVFGSKPRFLDADPTETTDKISILPPDRAKQDTYAYVHPVCCHGNCIYIIIMLFLSDAGINS